jgi:hypothetical protein
MQVEAHNKAKSMGLFREYIEEPEPVCLICLHVGQMRVSDNWPVYDSYTYIYIYIYIYAYYIHVSFYEAGKT